MRGAARERVVRRASRRSRVRPPPPRRRSAPDRPPMADRTAWRICSENGWLSVVSTKRRTKTTPGTPAHDDLVRRQFTATAPDTIWLADITEHPTKEGKLYLCAIKDVFSNRIVGYSIDQRMKARLAVQALDNAAARRAADGRSAAGCILHTDRGSQFRSRKMRRALTRHSMVGSMGQVGSAGDNAAMESFFALLAEQRPQPPPMADPRAPEDRDRDLDRTHLPPPPTTGPPRPLDPDRIRNDHDPNHRPDRLNQRCHQAVQQSPAAAAGRCREQPTSSRASRSAEPVARTERRTRGHSPRCRRRSLQPGVEGCPKGDRS